MPHITFIHGISNKPEATKLHAIWRAALAKDYPAHDDVVDLDSLGVTSSLVYWADVPYEKPLEGPSIEEEALQEEEFEGVVAAGPEAGGDPDMGWRQHLRGEEQRMVDALAAKLDFDVLVNDTFTRRPPRRTKPWNASPCPGLSSAGS